MKSRKSRDKSLNVRVFNFTQNAGVWNQNASLFCVLLRDDFTWNISGKILFGAVIGCDVPVPYLHRTPVCWKVKGGVL